MLVSATAGQLIISFVNSFNGCNQIEMHPLDEEKTTLRTLVEFSLQCHVVQTQNVSATYQRIMVVIFTIYYTIA